MPLERSAGNPIITRESIPAIAPHLEDATSVFNPGAIMIEGRYLLMLRVQSRGRETFLVMAESPDGIEFDVRPELVHFRGIEQEKERIYHVYDPRITEIEGSYYVVFAADTDNGCRLGVAQTRDFETFELVGLGRDRDIRNGVLLPERLGDRYVRLARPNTQHTRGEPISGDQIVLSESNDLVRWKRVASVARGRPHYWDERIGSGPPPVKTREGWLHVYHGVATHFGSNNIYQAGVMLLDLSDPSQVLSRSRNNILEPRESYELTGQVPNVVFPSGMIVEQYDHEGFAEPTSQVRLYYGAADTVVGLAVATIEDLIAACHD